MAQEAELWVVRAAVRRYFLLPFAPVLGLLLSACGARSSLTAPGAGADCTPWSVDDGVAGADRHAWMPFAALGDGSVVLSMSDAIDRTDSMGALLRYRLRKIDPYGEIVWDTLGGTDTLWLTGVARDAAGTLVVLGGVGSGTQSVLGATLTCSEVEACTFIGRLAETGTLAWSKVFPSDVTLTGMWQNNLAVTGDGRINVEGWFEGTLDFGCGPLTAIEGSGNRYLAQLSPSGECLWSHAILGTRWTTPGDDRVVVGDDGEVVLTLPLSMDPDAHTIDLGGGPVPLDTYKGPAFAVAKYAPNGDLVLVKVVTTESAEASIGTGAPPVNVAVIGAGELLLSTGYEGVLDLGGGPKGSPGTMRHFVTKLGANGEELWTRDIAEGHIGVPFAISARRGGDFFLAGHGLPGVKIAGAPTPDTPLFVAAYDAGGELLDMQTFPFAGSSWVGALDASVDGALVVVGDFQGTLALGQDLLVAKSRWDTFVARICR